MPEFHQMLGHRWWLVARPFEFLDDPGGGGAGGGGQGGGGDPPPDTRSLEEQAQAALDKLDKNETPTEAERSALRKANAELKRARDEAGRHRTESKAEKEAREKAEAELQQLREKHEPDEAKRAAEEKARADAEAERRKEQRELADARRELRKERMGNLFRDVAAAKEVNGRLAWPFLADQLKDVDPADEAEARKAIGKALDQAVKDEPGLKLAKFGASGGGGGFEGGGGGGNGRAKSLQEAVDNAFRAR
jgi:hypothetical protein